MSAIGLIDTNGTISLETYRKIKNQEGLEPIVSEDPVLEEIIQELTNDEKIVSRIVILGMKDEAGTLTSAQTFEYDSLINKLANKKSYAEAHRLLIKVFKSVCSSLDN